MLIIKCSRCKKKIFKYQKIGSGAVLKCHFSKITEWLIEAPTTDLFCECNNKIGIKKDDCYKMIEKSFVARGQKIKK